MVSSEKYAREGELLQERDGRLNKCRGVMF